jgi:hypothetical protein
LSNQYFSIVCTIKAAPSPLVQGGVWYETYAKNQTYGVDYDRHGWRGLAGSVGPL